MKHPDMQPAVSVARGYPRASMFESPEHRVPMQQSARPAFPVSIAAIVLFLVAALFLRSLLDVTLQRSGLGREFAGDLSYLVVPPMLVVLMLPYLRRCRASLWRLFAPNCLTLRVVVCAVALGLMLRLMWWASITSLIGVGLVRGDDPSPVIGPVLGWDCPQLPEMSLGLFVMCGLTPLFEELLHRGFLLHAILPRGPMLAIFSSSLIFALAHDAPYVFPAAFGIIVAVQTINWRALWGPVLTHATFNGISVLDWRCFRVVWNPEAGDPALATVTGIAFAVLALTIVGVTLLVGPRAAGASGPPQPG